jgi:hypothetical protein
MTEVRVAIHQPNLLARPKVLQKLLAADVWIVLDDVQFAERDYQQRAWLVPTRRGQPPRWCSLPLDRSSGKRRPINQIRLSGRDPLRLLRNGLTAAFRNDEYIEGMLTAMELEFDASDPLTSLGVAATRYQLHRLGREIQPVRSSDLRDAAAPKTEGVLELCRVSGASTYLADSGALRYLQDDSLKDAGFRVLWQIWSSVELAGLRPDDVRNGSAVNIYMRDPATHAALLRSGHFAHERPTES